jgi:hypothetical protein
LAQDRPAGVGDEIELHSSRALVRFPKRRRGINRKRRTARRPVTFEDLVEERPAHHSANTTSKWTHRRAQDLGNVRVLAVASDGTVYATRRDEGDVLMLKDPGNGGLAGAPVRVASRSGAGSCAGCTMCVLIVTSEA